MSKYVPYKDVAMLALSSMSVLNGEWQLAIQGLPTIDIVRCSECKYYENEWCYWRDEAITADDFCSYGQKGDENVETD